MGEWEEYKLRDITHRITKGTTPSSLGRGFSEQGINFIKSESVGYDGRIDHSAFCFIDIETHHKLKRSQLEHQDILFSMAGIYLGKTGFVTQDILPANTNQALAIIRVDKKKALPKFVHYVLRQKSITDYVNSMSSQSAQPNINMEEIGSIDVFLPPLPQQEAIVEVLSGLDDKIDLLQRNSKSLDALSGTLFRQWFITQSDEGWKTVTVGDVADINKQSISRQYAFAEIKYLDTGSITEGNISEYQIVTLSEAPSRAQRIVQENDIVYSVVRPAQRHYGLLYNVKPNTVVSTGFCVVTGVKVSPYFLYIMLKSNETVEYLDMLAEASTSTYPSLKPSDISNLQFQMPPQDLLNSFDKIVKPMWDKISANQIQIQLLTQLRDTLLPKLMNGTVKVNELVEA